jgi:predicted DNA-binding transcriptional regulator YafY
VLLAALPAVARDLGIDSGAGERTLLTAMDTRAEAAARSVRERLLVEPDDWFRPREAVPCLLPVARALWEGREVRITYRAADHTVRPLGLVLKGPTWYLLARGPRAAADRLYRVARITAATLLPHRFEPPDGFDLEAAWAERKRQFLASIPRCLVSVRVAPEGEGLLALLQEGTPDLPLPAGTPRDGGGWAHLQLRFERPDSAARLLLQLGGLVEVLDPPEVRSLMAGAAAALSRLYPRGGRASG